MQHVKIDTKFERIMFVGDLHGNFGHIRYLLRIWDIRNAVLVQVGDFGIGFHKKGEAKALIPVNEELISRNVLLVVIRGNHDDPFYFKNDYYLSNILMLEDYTMVDLNINGMSKRMLGIGGAISIDRLPRRFKGDGWWSNEVFDARTEPEYLNQFTGVNYLVTHTADSGVEPYAFGKLVYHFAKNDPTLLDELRKERSDVTRVLWYIMEKNSETLQEHFYGHFHFSATGWNKGFRRTLLDVGELKEIHVQVCDNFDDYGEGPKPSGDRDQADA